MLEKVMDKSLRKVVTIGVPSLVFSQKREQSMQCFFFRQVQEKVLEKREKLFFAFLDLEKAYDRVLREVVYLCMRRREIQEKFVRMFKQHLRR